MHAAVGNATSFGFAQDMLLPTLQLNKMKHEKISRSKRKTNHETHR